MRPHSAFPIPKMHVWSKLSSARWADAWEERFHALEDTRLVITSFPGRPTVRVELYCRTRRQAEAVQREFGGTVRRLAADWAAPASAPTPPVVIRRHFVITAGRDPDGRAALERRYPGRHVLSVPAELAFGTGDHATTATCLRILCDLHDRGALAPGFRCLDLGCGTGVLAIAAQRLGASHCHGIDYDPAAVRVARSNAATNRCPRRAVTFARADALAWDPAGRYDLVFANLFSDVLARLFPNLRRALAPGSHLVVSGMLNEQAPACLAAARAAGLQSTETRRRGKWTTALLRRPTP
jgi:ribosomal protein L11 methyltransferase